MRLFICASLLAMTLAAGDAFADASAGENYFSVMATFMDDDKDRNVDDGLNGGQFSFGRAMHQYWNLEAAISMAAPESTNGRGKLTSLGVDAQFVLMRDSRFTPYLHAGIASLSWEPPTTTSSSGGAISGGVGFYLDMFGSSDIALRGEWKYREDKASSQKLADNLFSLGLQFPFGKKSAPVVVAAAVAADGDGDGVPDTSDACPNTPAGVAVDSRGCERDDDGDGVANSADNCPGTVRGAPVDAMGCELDSDGDGVVDRLDECPDTTAGVQVDIKGCEIKAEIRLRGVNFESNSDTLASGATSVLNDAVATLRQNPTIKFEVAGHTDSVGDDAYNESLSARRAQTVYDYLATNGIAEDRMTVRGYGEAEPVADNGTNEGRAENRRVVLRITER